MTRARRTDRNHSEVIGFFRTLGCSVVDLSAVGRGCPDLLVGRGGVDSLVEVKDGRQSPSARKLNELQERFRVEWRGREVVVVETLDDCAEVVEGLMVR